MTDALEESIRSARLKISSDGYPMSIGELTNLYRDGELIIRPEFQRFFRWTDSQKSHLVESILLGIPLPSIFVAQTESGKWELVDGLQRVSTLLQLQGVLKDSVPLTLMATKYLPDLEGCQWADGEGVNSLSEALRLDIKRSKIDVKIIQRESSPQAKFDLFQRLNNYGTQLSPQEMRSALLVGAAPNFFAWLESLSNYPSFCEATVVSERQRDERFDLELVLRFIVLHNRPERALKSTALRDFSQLLDSEALSLAISNPNGSAELEETFQQTFDLICANGAEDVFRKWDPHKRSFRGSFLNTSFEVFACGVGFHIVNGTPFRKDLLTAVKEFWERPDLGSGFATGKSTEARLARFVPMGRSHLSSE
jgi:hypothetical protein